jgi:uncharacterized protein (TIGR02598 family)
MCHSRKSRGFTLAEVVVAIGIVAFAIIAILGLLPLALGTQRSSMNEAREAQIVRAITGTIDAQCASFISINCYGAQLNLASLDKAATPIKLYASYPVSSTGTASDQPTINSDLNSVPNYIYTVELRFDNAPPLNAPAGVTGGSLPPGKANLIEIYIYPRAQGEGAVDFFHLARNKA